MSAFMVSDDHINAIVLAAREGDMSYELNGVWKKVKGNEQECANLLYEANAESVYSRYPSERPKRVESDSEWATSDENSIVYVSPRLLSGIQIIKLCQCFNYQACEVDDYEKTWASAFINRVIANQVHRIEGYDEAEWAI